MAGFVRVIMTPTADEIKAARHAARLSQEEAAALVSRERLAWHRWEKGDPIDMACWELFLIKTKKARQKSGV